MPLKKIKITSLKKGDAIAIISTARKVTKKELHFAVSKIESWGLSVCFGEHLFEEHHQFAGTVKQRTKDLQWALDHENIKAIFFARGGYGSVQVLDHLNWKAFAKNPKWLIGFSDATVFHSHVQQNYKYPTLHAAMPITFFQNTATALDNLRNILFGKKVSYTFNGHPFNREGLAKSEIVGGNLSILYSLLGSKSQLNTDGKILFLEDLDEYLYHIDRMMQALKRGGMLKNLTGLIVGGMTNMNDNSIPFGKTSEEIIRDVVSEYSYPLAFNIPAGHMNHNVPLLLGEQVIFRVTTDDVLIE
tara:strand:+ start:422 stop:1327 length:906 start_codon:yes stop_codon:yes gene_type:complete